MSDHYLKALFDPTSIVIIGASDKVNTEAAFITKKLNQEYSGKLYFVNPKHKEVACSNCYKSVKDIDQQIDLAIIVSPIKTVEKVIRECAAKGLLNALVMTKFPTQYKSEVTAAMKSLKKVAADNNVRLLGPNASALVRTYTNFNASFTNNNILAGKLALVSRSTTICNSIIDWAETEQVGFSTIISRVSDVDVDLADILDYLATDYRTNSIIIYINHIKNSRRFMSALQAAAKLKPVVILKSSHENGSYSDAIAKTPGTRAMHDVFNAAVSRAGADTVSSLTNLYSAAKILASNQRTKGNKLGIISNGYGPVMLANDRLRDLKIEPTKHSHSLVNQLKSTSDKNINIDNAVIVFDTTKLTQIYIENIQHLLISEEIDAIAIFLAPDAMINIEEVATAIANIIQSTKKPILAAWLGNETGRRGREILIKHKISNYRTPEAAIEAFSFLNHHLENRKRLLQAPYPLRKQLLPNISFAQELIERNLNNNRHVLSKADSIALLEAFHIRCNKPYYPESEADAVKIADKLGYPVVLKIDSQFITYKSDIQGVKLNIEDDKMLSKYYQQFEKSISKLSNTNATIHINSIIVEKMYAPASGRVLCISILNDPEFGPVISFGPGGTLSPAIKDRAMQLPPLNRRQSEDLINATQVSLILNKYRNLPATNREKLREVLIRVSEIATHLPQIFEVILNPIILDEYDAVVNDVQIVIRKAKKNSKLFSHLAIHPYPSNWHRHITIKKNKKVEVRPIRAEDAQQVVNFVKNMSKESKYFRFMHVVNELTTEMISNLTKLDYDREMAFGAFIQKKNNDKLIGMSRYSINPDKKSCEFAITVDDNYHGMGLAKQLMLILIEHVKDQDLKTIEGTVLKNNDSMNKLMSSLGFVKHPSKEDYDINIFTFEFIS